MSGAAYSWKPPLYFEGQRIIAMIGRVEHHAIVRLLETRYRGNGEAWHSYSVAPDGWATRRWLTEREMRPLPCEAHP